MKFRHKLMSALTAAAALLIVCGVTALGLKNAERPMDDAVMPQSSVFAAATEGIDVTVIGGRDLPANTEIYVNVDPDAFVPWFYSTKEVVLSGKTDETAYLHMDFNCSRMEAGEVVDVPLLGSINELGLQLCPDCFTLGDMEVRHDGETACLPYHNRSGQESTLAEAVAGGLPLCEYCLMEVYTSPDNLYIHCEKECLNEWQKKFIHSASAAGLDACPDCMPPSVDPVTGIAAPVIYRIPLPTPSPEDFLTQNPDWPVQQAFASPTPPSVNTTMQPEIEMGHIHIDAKATPTPAPVATRVPAEPTPTPKPFSAEETEEITITEMAHAAAYSEALSTPEPKPSDEYPPSVLAATSVFYSAEGDSLIHFYDSCGGVQPVSLLGALRDGKRICTDYCSAKIYVLVDTAYNGEPTGGSSYTTSPMTKEYFHASSECTIAQDGHLLRVPVPQAVDEKYSPCPNCFYDVYIQDNTYHLRSDCVPGMVERSYFAYAVSDDCLACPLCVHPYTTAYLNAMEIAIVEEIGGAAQPDSIGNKSSLREIAAAPGSLADNGVKLYADPEAADAFYHSRISCQYMQNAIEVSYAEMFENAYSVCGWCLNLDNKLAKEVEYAYLTEIPPLALAGVNSLNEAVEAIAGE